MRISQIVRAALIVLGPLLLLGAVMFFYLAPRSATQEPIAVETNIIGITATLYELDTGATVGRTHSLELSFEEGVATTVFRADKLTSYSLAWLSERELVFCIGKQARVFEFTNFGNLDTQNGTHSYKVYLDATGECEVRLP